MVVSIRLHGQVQAIAEQPVGPEYCRLHIWQKRDVSGPVFAFDDPVSEGCWIVRPCVPHRVLKCVVRAIMISMLCWKNNIFGIMCC
jgi:hypothetical protein